MRKAGRALRMAGWTALWALSICVCSLWIGEAAAQTPPAAPPLSIHGVRIDVFDAVTRISILSDAPVVGRISVLDQPARLTLDMQEADWLIAARAGTIDSALVRGYRFAPLMPGASRLALELAQPARIVSADRGYDAGGNEYWTVIELSPKDGIATRVDESGRYAKAEEPQPGAVAQGASPEAAPSGDPTPRLRPDRRVAAAPQSQVQPEPRPEPAPPAPERPEVQAPAAPSAADALARAAAEALLAAAPAPVPAPAAPAAVPAPERMAAAPEPAPLLPRLRPARPAPDPIRIAVTEPALAPVQPAARPALAPPPLAAKPSAPFDPASIDLGRLAELYPKLASDGGASVERLTVAIDAGHGGKDPGAVREGVLEKTLVLAFARDLAKVLRASGRFDVLMTRDDDTFVDLAERVEIARAARAHVFLSIHADAIEDGDASGLTAYTLSEEAGAEQVDALSAIPNPDGLSIAGADLSGADGSVRRMIIDLARRETQTLSGDLARHIVREAERETPIVRRGVRHAGYRVLKAPDTPSILIELGFLSDQGDRAKMADPGWRNRVAKAVLTALDKWRDGGGAQGR